MPFLLSSRNAVALVRWETPEHDDFDRLLERLAKVKREAGPVVCVSLVAEGAGVPRPDTAIAWGRRLPELFDVCASLHKVFEGQGFGVGVKRSVLTGMILTAGRFGASRFSGRYAVHDSLASVIGALARPHRDDLAALAALDRAA